MSASRAKPEFGAQHDAHLRPAGADLGDEARHLFDRPGAGIDVGGPQLGAEQMVAAEDGQRQVAVAVVIAVEEEALLVPVQRVIGGIEIQHDLGGRGGRGIQKQLDEEPLDRRPSCVILC